MAALSFAPLKLQSWAPAAWRMPVKLLAATWLALIALFLSDWAAMADQWWNISTYSHVLLIPAILAWMAHARWPQLSRLEPHGWKPGLLLFGGSAFFWVLGTFSGLDLARQLGAVAMLIASALTLLGPRVGAGLAFPLGYMLLLVPFGDELVVPMQMVTAKLTIWLTRLSSIPAEIDGVFIDTPAGLFEVAEACSGVKFLIAMFAFALLTANVCFRSWRRRAVFFAFAMLVPILANGVRAWGTIYLAQSLGAEKATGIDHIIYGWIFFALVIALILAISWRFFDRPGDDPMIDAAAIAASPLLGRLETGRIGGGGAVGFMALLALAALAWAAAAGGMRAALPGRITLPEVPGWQRTDYTPREAWQPRAGGADHRLLGRYTDGEGHEADVFLALYAAQGDGREAGGFGEGALRQDSGWSWLSPGPAIVQGKSERLLGKTRTVRLAQTHYRTGKLLTGSNVSLKLAGIGDRLLLRARPTAMLILSAEERPGKPQAAQSLALFRRSTGDTGAWMDRITALR
jgi:exosortase A